MLSTFSIPQCPKVPLLDIRFFYGINYSQTVKKGPEILKIRLHIPSQATVNNPQKKAATRIR